MKNLFFLFYFCVSRIVQHATYTLLDLLKNGEKKLGQKYFIGVVLMDLSKAFDCIPYFLVIAKLAAFTHT